MPNTPTLGGNAEALQRSGAGKARFFDQIRRQPRQRVMDGLMQRGMQDAQAAADQHHEHLFFRRPGQARDQPGIARKRNAGGVDRGLVVRAADDRVRRTLTNQRNGRFHIGDGGAPRGSVDLSGSEVRGGQRIDRVQEDGVARWRAAFEVPKRSGRGAEFAIMPDDIIVSDQDNANVLVAE
jgi:hypothetical protein